MVEERGLQPQAAAEGRCSTPGSKVRLRSGFRSGLPRAKKATPKDSKKLGSLIPAPALALSVVLSGRSQPEGRGRARHGPRAEAVVALDAPASVR